MFNRFFKNIFCVVTVSVFLFSCGESKKKKIRIGLAMDTYTEERWKKDGDFFEARAVQLGAEVIRQVCNGNEQLQNEQVENLLTSGVDVLVIVPHNSKTTAAAVNSAHKSGVKVIAYDRLIRDCDLDYYISFDAVKVGELQAKYLLEKAPKGNYIIIAGSPTDENAILFRKGQMNILQPEVDKGNIKIVLDQFAKDWLPIEALKQTQNALTLTQNNLSAVVTSNDGLASGAIQALTEQGLAGKIPVSGQDAEQAAVQRILDGTQSMTIYKPIKKLACTAAEAAVAIAKGEKLNNTNSTLQNGKTNVPSILIESTVIDKNNIKQTVIADGFINASRLKGL
jgi:D-xylose transport system substrate-binding protein